MTQIDVAPQIEPITASIKTSASAAADHATPSAVDLVIAMKPFTPDALANGMATLVGALVGVTLAYMLQRRMQASVEEKNARTSGQRLMFSLFNRLI